MSGRGFRTDGRRAALKPVVIELEFGGGRCDAVDRGHTAGESPQVFGDSVSVGRLAVPPAGKRVSSFSEVGRLARSRLVNAEAPMARGSYDLQPAPPARKLDTRLPEGHGFSRLRSCRCLTGGTIVLSTVTRIAGRASPGRLRHDMFIAQRPPASPNWRASPRQTRWRRKMTASVGTDAPRYSGCQAADDCV